MRKIAAVVIAGLVLAAAPAAASAKVVVRNVVLQTTSGFFVPSGSTGGSLFGGTGELRQGGAAVGRFSSTCIVANPVRAQCGMTLIWTGRGRIQIAGSIRTGNDHNIASITGGSGEFRGARGTAKLEKASADGSRQRAKLRFLS